MKLTCSGSFVFSNFKNSEWAEKERKTLFFCISEVLPLDAAIPAWRIKFSLSANMAELHVPTGWLFHHYQNDECVLHTESSAMKFPSSSTHISLSPNPPFSLAYARLLEQDTSEVSFSALIVTQSCVCVCENESMKARREDEWPN